MVDTSGVVVKFSDVGVLLVNIRVLCKSSMGLAHLSTLQADPRAARGGCHRWGGEDERRWEAGGFNTC